MDIIRASYYLQYRKAWRRTMHEFSQIDDLRIMKDVRRMVALSSAKTTDSIVVVGPQNLEYLAALLRSGFDCAACISGYATCGFAEPIDHLFISGPLGDDQLALVVASFGRRLHRDGAVVARLRDVGQDRVITEGFRGLGLFEQQPVFDGSAAMLVVHHLRPSERLAIAA